MEWLQEKVQVVSEQLDGAAQWLAKVHIEAPDLETPVYEADRCQAPAAVQTPRRAPCAKAKSKAAAKRRSTISIDSPPGSASSSPGSPPGTYTRLRNSSRASPKVVPRPTVSAGSRATARAESVDPPVGRLGVRRTSPGAPRPRTSAARSIGNKSNFASLATDTVPQNSDAPPACSRSAQARKSEQEILTLWRMLDRRKSGEVKVADIVQNATTLQKRCPEVLEQYSEIARGGRLTLNDLRRFYSVGTSVATRGKRSNDQQKTASCGATMDVGLDEIKRIWCHLDAESCGTIGLTEVLKHASFLRENLPELISEFEKIDTNKDAKISVEDLFVFFNTEAWLRSELQKVVGLSSLKEQLTKFHRSISLDRRRIADGFEVSSGGKLHMIFRGNPGTGKTSMGRMMAKLLHRIGSVPTSDFHEVQRPDLVAEHVGQTGPKTRKIIEEAKDGILFIDEAYRLSSIGANDFGREAIEELMGAMNEVPGKAPVQIYAGYPDDMDKWMKTNEGLYRRIAYTFDFQDYTPLELAEILRLHIESRGFKLETAFQGDEGHSRLASLLEKHTLPRARQMMNAGLCERVFEAAKQCLDARDDPLQPSVTLVEADILDACERIPPPPEPSSSAVPTSPQPQLATADAQRYLAVCLHAGSVMDSRTLAFVAGAMPSMSAHVVVSFGGAAGEKLRQAWKSCKGQGSHLQPSWEQNVVLSLLPQDHLLDVSVYDTQPLIGDCFLGSAQLALSAVPPMGFSGELELRKDDSISGALRLELFWQVGIGRPERPFRKVCVI